MSSFSELTFTDTTKVLLSINGVEVNATWPELATQLTKYSCGPTECGTDIASLASLDIFFLLFSAALVFIMQAGFTLLEVGSVHVKNTKNILTKNIGDAMIGALSFYCLGFAFGPSTAPDGEGGNGFIGSHGFALTGAQFYGPEGLGFEGQSYIFWLFQWAFAATAATIVSGAVAERVTFEAYFIYSFFLTAFIYPVVSHWGWSGDGWASAFRDSGSLLFSTGVIDFAGSGVVHMTGGLAALVGAVLLGPRTGRFDGNGFPVALSQQSMPFQTLGTMILWFGWYGFNCGSALSLQGQLGAVAAKTAVTTTLSAAMSGLCTVLWGKIWGPGYICPALANNGILAGLVGITASCAVVEPEAAIVIGFVSSLVYTVSSNLLLKLHIDDVVDAVPVHLACGIWGVMAPAFFTTAENHYLAYGFNLEDTPCGLFYSCTSAKQWNQLGAQLVFILAIIAWVGGCAVMMFGSMKAGGILRVSLDVEHLGLDASEHGGHAYGKSSDDGPIIATAGSTFPDTEYHASIE